MKQIDRIEQIEQWAIDLDEQVKQLRSDNAVMSSKLKEMSRQLGVRLKEELNSKQETKLQQDLRFAHAVREMLKMDHPMVNNRDVFTTRHMHMMVHSFVDEKLHNVRMSALRTGWTGPDFHKINAELRTMTSSLVNSGLFTRRKTQQYVPVNPHDIEDKPSTTKATVIITDNFKRYAKMTDSALGAVMVEQRDRALVLYNKALKQHREEDAAAELELRKKQMVDTEVSFL